MRALSLEYHDVFDGDADATGFPGPGPASYKLARHVFEQHLDAIARRVAHAPQRIVDRRDSASGAPPLFLTFDDGGVSAWTIADALERRGWRGHFFVTAGRIGSPTFLSPHQIRALHDRGHVIGSHSYSHPARMGGCSEAQLRDEWSRSVDTLSGILRAPILTASVPGGFYTGPVAETAAEAGIRYLFTSAPTTRVADVNECTVLGRYTLRSWSTDRTAAALAVGAWKPRAAQWALYSSLTLLRHVAGDHYTRLRQLFWKRRG